MALKVTRLRRWFAVGAILVVAVVVGAYFLAKRHLESTLNKVPEKIGIEIQQSAQGFTVSKSEAGRTIFKIQASKVVQYKLGGRAELHDVNITIYGKDANRFDQIYGKDFEYDPQSGDVTAQGEVQIDLEPNPGGGSSPDQAPPKELRDPLHFKTSGMVFNQKTGNAHTKERVEFQVPQAGGSAVGVTYDARKRVLTLQSQVEVQFHGPAPMTLTAARGTITKEPQMAVLEQPQVVSGSRRTRADKATLFLRPDNKIERVLAEGKVEMEAGGEQSGEVKAQELELVLSEQATLRRATFSGDVRMQVQGEQPMQGSAGRVQMTFRGKNELVNVHTQDNVKIWQRQTAASTSNTSAGEQDMELTAPAMDFQVAGGHRLRSAETSGPPQLAIRSVAQKGEQTLVAAGKFSAQFDKAGKLVAVHGAPDARIVNSSPGQPERVSTSEFVDAAFTPGKGIGSITQQGKVAYVDGERKAWGDRARYTPADHVLVLSGSPRVVDGGMTTTARSMRLNRLTGDALADGDVKSTYSELKAQPNGALLASASPIHVTARSMTAHKTPSVALYTGGARIWQDANVVEAPSIEFDRGQRTIQAKADAGQRVSMVLVQIDKKGKITPVAVTASQLTYSDGDRKAHLQGDVVAKGGDLVISAAAMDVFFHPRGGESGNQTSAGRIDRIVAQQNVVITQPRRRAVGEELVYTAEDDKFVLSGGTPSIFDAELGKITGVSLTFFRADDRVLVEGNQTSPTVTRTRVAR
ncbi:MAG: LPS export ABC transporter periplasmic protein LptC [Acidobacteria bacterium]|nr:LPS export ABC transporter periplasmic protein LptC [Acidobacteriota bacterium]